MLTSSLRIDIQIPDGIDIQDHIEDLDAWREECRVSNVDFSQSRSRGIDPSSAIIVAILGAVAPKLITVWLDRFLEKRSQKQSGAQLVVVWNGRAYTLPKDRPALDRAMKHKG